VGSGLGSRVFIGGSVVGSGLGGSVSRMGVGCSIGKGVGGNVMGGIGKVVVGSMMGGWKKCGRQLGEWCWKGHQTWSNFNDIIWEEVLV